MRPILTRRNCLALIPLTAAATALRATGAQPATAQPASTPPTPSDTPTIPDTFPSQDPTKVREMVGVSHGNLERVTALLKEAPQLANATYDWGFGDWETALGAASHTGRRQIADLLMQHGARPDIFTYAMLGHLDAVRTMLAARPGLQRTRGPHGITLLSHAKAGGDESKPVADYLATLGDADIPYPTVELPTEQRALYTGEYSFGPREGQRLHVQISERGAGLTVRRPPGPARGLLHQGNHAFHPVGAPDVRLTFTVEAGRAVRVDVAAPAPLCTATRI